eukprot:g4951.t1
MVATLDPKFSTADPMAFMAPEAAAEPQAGMDAFSGMAPAGPIGGLSPDSMSGNNAALKEWETQLEEKNQKKAAAELQAKKKKREEAKIALQKWYSDRKTALQKTMTSNRREEKEWLAIQNSSGEGKNPWEKVLSMISEGGDPGKTEAAPLQDVSRFKQLLIQLKSNPVAN